MEETSFYGKEIGVQLFAEVAGIKIPVAEYRREGEMFGCIARRREEEIKTCQGYEEARSRIREAVAVNGNIESFDDKNKGVHEKLTQNLHNFIKEKFPFIERNRSSASVGVAPQNAIDVTRVINDTMTACVAKVDAQPSVDQSAVDRYCNKPNSNNGSYR